MGLNRIARERDSNLFRRYSRRAAYATLTFFVVSNPVAGKELDETSTLLDALPRGRETFEEQLGTVTLRRESWLEKAEQATPVLFSSMTEPVAVVEVLKDSEAFQGWRVAQPDSLESIYNTPCVPGDEFILDFGEHLTGYFSFSLRHFGVPVDAPVRLNFVFGERPAEVAESLDLYAGSLPRSWFQDETVTVDVVPQTVRLPRRYAFRYVKVSVVSSSRDGKFGFSRVGAEAMTSADKGGLSSFIASSEEDKAIYRVALRTLQNCMQTVFEDGPKRDRRLWLGDLRLQALANYATFRNYDLVKRSLYLLAATVSDEGLVSTCAMERPEPMRGAVSILDYTALFASVVLEYFEASGDRETAEDLWPLVMNQLEFTLATVDAEGLFIPSEKWWMFVDWNPALDKQAPEHAIILVGLKDTQKLAEKLGREEDVAFLPAMIERMEAAARKHLWDETKGMFSSGSDRQFSWASQAWMVLAEVCSPEQGRRALLNAMKEPLAEKPVTPYMYHYMVEALVSVELEQAARQLLNDYWGGMVQKGADTFWEVYVPGNDIASPYGSHLMNSYCHAWSCTPTYFLRTRFSAGKPTLILMRGHDVPCSNLNMKVKY